MIFYIFLFITSCFILFWATSFLIHLLIKIGKFMGWREFVVAFFVLAFAASLPNFFVGVNSAIHKIPVLSFGDIVGGNIINLTLAIALSIFIGGKSILADSRMVQKSAIFVGVVALLPIVLILDGVLGRIDGIILLLSFAVYVGWLFSKKERFKKVYQETDEIKPSNFKNFFKDLIKIVFFLGLLLLASEGVVRSAREFSLLFALPVSLVGILIVGFGNALPQIYFSVVAARKNQGWMILGAIFGSVVFMASFVLGIVALIHPIEVIDFSSFAVARLFLLLAVAVFIIFLKTSQKVSKIESIILLFIYIIFVISQILTV